MSRKPVVVTIEAGAPRVEWCDRCLHSHGFVRVYLSDDDPTRIKPIGEWADHDTPEE